MYDSLISPTELNELLPNGETVVIDCRYVLNDQKAGISAYLSSHIPGAYYAHLEEDLSGEIIPGKTGRHPLPHPTDFADLCNRWGIGNHTQVVAYDQSHGGMAARLWFLMRWLGHHKTAVLNGGWNAWTQAGLPTSTEIPPFTEGTFSPKENKKLLVPAEKVAKMATDPKYRVFDSRTADRYRGENETIDPVAGHIPGAVSASFLDNVGPDGVFLEKETLAKRFDNLLDGLPTEQSVFYCGSGVTACHNLLAMSYIGKEGAKLYPGSWSEWITDKNRPVATADTK